jgi:hypothetical protein
MAKNSRKTANKRSPRRSKAQELKDDPNTAPLNRELREISLLDDPLDPRNLVGRTALEDCAAAKQWLSGGETSEEIAEYVSLAIERAVAGIRLEKNRDRYIAEAIVGMGVFRGCSNEARRSRLTNAPFRVSRDIYDKRRPHAVGKIIFNLHRPTQVHRLEPGSVGFSTHRGLVGLNGIAMDAVDLYYSCLTLFATSTPPRQIEILLGRGQSAPFHGVVVPADAHQFSEYVFRDLFRFWTESSYLTHMAIYRDYDRVHENFTVVGSFSAILDHPAIAQHLESSQRVELNSLYRRILESAPIAEDRINALCLRYAEDIRRVPMEIDWLLKEDFSSWEAWLHADTQNFVMSLDVPANPVLDAPYPRFVASIRQFVRLFVTICGGDVWSERARWIALKRSALAYEVNENKSDHLFNQSLTEYLFSHFDKADRALAKVGVPWLSDSR